MVLKRSSRTLAMTMMTGVLLFGLSTFGGPQQPQAPSHPFVPSNERNYSPEEVKEIQEIVKDMDLFKEAAKSYNTTVNSLVKREYEKRRQGLLDKYEKRIKVEEAEERVRRIAAITLFEDFLRRYPNDRRWTPDVIFRLAELYFEKSNDEYLQATEDYDKQMALFDKGQLAGAPTPPKQDYSQTIELHRKLIREFPRYRLIDGAYYLLGFCLTEMGDLERGNQGFLALVCSNKYRPPLEDTVATEPSQTEGDRRGPQSRLPTRREKPRFDTKIYASCKPLIAKSRFNPESWIRIGEYHFDENELGPAIGAYQNVLNFGPKENTYYDSALYKLAWTYYRADKFIEAIKQFDRLVVYSDKLKEETGKRGTEMRPESIQYLGISFSEEDWDGDTLPDSETGIQRLEKFYKGRHKEKHVYEVYQRLADIYFDTTKYEEAINLYKIMLKEWPLNENNPVLQDKVILSLERQRKFDQAINEREEFSRLFGKGSEWERANKNNPKALRKAQNIDEQALIQAAVFHHKAAKTLKDRAVAMGDGNMLEQAKQEYSLAAKAYEKYLERFPNTKNSYEIRYSYATCLFYSERFLEAGKAFAEVRDSNLDNQYQEEAAFSAAKAYEEYIDQGIKQGKLPNPDVPKVGKDEKVTEPVKAIQLPDVYVKWQEALDAYKRTIPKGAKTPRLTYKAAEISFRFHQFDDARKRFSAIYKEYCTDPMSLNAGQAILVTYQLEQNLPEMEKWATNLQSGKCGGGTGLAKQTAEQARELYEGIQFKKAMDLYKAKNWDEAAKAFLALVDAGLKGKEAGMALNNAAVCYEQSKRFESATKIYERLWKEFPDSEFAHEALWRSALNYKRFFEFDRAVQNYLILADSPKFATSKYRVDSIYNAAVILENDQAYARAAKLFLRYAKEIDKPKEAAEAHFRAGEIYGKMGDYSMMVKTFRDFNKTYSNQAGQGRYVVEGTFKIAKNAQDRKDWNTAKKYYKQTIAEFSNRGLKPASDAAEFAAQASFELAERVLQDFLKIKMKGSIQRLVAQKKILEKKAIALKKEYEDIWKYKRAKWTLAAMYRRGTIFEHFARTMDEGFRNAPVPAKVKRLGQEAIDIYMSQVDQILAQQVDPITEEAKKLYKECIERARELGISNQYTEEALRKLNAFDPSTWPLLKRAKLETTID